ncbi:MAG: hypothetical protein U9N07_08915 [Euryarchaeota archaeon]|nr:hypothetical protein [Euryarchaeota archaeon]
MKKITFAAAILLLIAILITISILGTGMLGVDLLNHTQETNDPPEIENRLGTKGERNSFKR